MYSGITRGLFDVTSLEKKPGLFTYTVRLNEELLDRLTLGASVAVDGVCQTVVAIAREEVTFQAIQDTLNRTTLQDLYVGRKVSIERSLRYGDEVGGHEVAGHVIGMGTVSAVISTDHSLDLTITCSPEWMKYIFLKGFIAVDGSSLTVDQPEPQGQFGLHIIPETLRLTNFGQKKVGDRVNIELDHQTQTIVATVERVLAAQSPRPG